MKKSTDINDKFYLLEKEFRDQFKKIRKSNGYTQETLATKCNMIRETIARIESGLVSPQLNTIIKMLEPIGYTLEIKKIEVEVPLENEEKTISE